MRQGEVLSINDRLGGKDIMSTSECCAHCQTATKIRKRDFSDQAWAVLVVWDEVDRGVVGQLLCDPCYSELREVLIDRADEIEAALSAGKTPSKSAGKKTVRKAG